MTPAQRSIQTDKEYHFETTPGIVVGACAHGLSVIRALHEGRVPVLALETNLNLPAVRTRLAQIEQVEDINGDGLIKALLDLRPRLHCPGKPILFLTNDNMVRTLTVSGAVLDPHYLLSWSDCRDKIAALLNKSDLENHCRKQGLRYPPTYILKSKADIAPAMMATGSSVIVKPARPLSGFKTAFPRHRRDFEQLIEQFGSDLPLLAQKFIPGDDSNIYFCALYLDQGNVVARFTGRKLRSRPLGHTTIAVSTIQEDVYRETIRFFSDLRLSGPVSLELKRDAAGDLWVIEPTIGRTDFWLGLCTANHINIPLSEYRNQLSIVEKHTTQLDCAVWFNEERDPFGRLWIAFHPEFGMGRRHSSYVYLHQDDIAPTIEHCKHALSQLIIRLLRRLSRLPRLSIAREISNAYTAAPTDTDDNTYTVESYLHPSEFPADVIEFFVRAGNRNFDSSLYWYKNLLDTVVTHDLSTVRFYVLRRQNVPTVALPIIISRESLHSEIQSLSNYYTALYSPLLSQEGDTADLQHLLSVVAKNHKDAQAMRFLPMDKESPAYHALLSGLRESNWIPFQFFCFGNWFLSVEGTWENYLSRRSTNLRSAIKRRSKRFLADGGTLEIVTSIGDDEKFVKDFQEVYLSSWKSPEPYPDFIPSLIHRLSEAGMLRLGVARLEERTIAAQLWIVDKKKASIYKVAYHSDFASYSPGTVLTAHLLQYVMDCDHVTEVDFLIGDDSYKRAWMNNRRERWGIVAYNPRTIIGLALFAKEIANRIIKPVYRKVFDWLGPRKCPTVAHRK